MENNSGAIVLVKIDEIMPNRFQPRRYFDRKLLEELAESIDSQGLHQPIILRPLYDGDKKYEIIAGERRWRAHKMLEKDRIQSIIKEMTDIEAAEAALTENLQRVDLNPIEEALSIAKLMEQLNINQQQLANRLGKSRSHIANMIRLSKIPEYIQDIVASGNLDKWHALTLSSISDSKHQEELLKKSIKNKWSHAKLKSEIKKIKSPDSVESENNKTKKNNPTGPYIALVEFQSFEQLKEIRKLCEDRDILIWSGNELVNVLKEGKLDLIK